MPYEPKDNSGALFKNDRKSKESAPDYKGRVLVAGVAYWLAGWIKKGKNGTFLSLAFTAIDEPQQERRPEATAPVDDAPPF